MEIRHLRYFLAIAEAGGFSRAAARLRVAQSALSRQIADLEEELKVRLFERSRRGARLTYPGECFLEDARRMIVAMERAQLRAFDAQNGKVGSLAIGMVESFSWHDLVTRPIYDFRRQNPAVSLALSMMTTVEQIAALREQRISAGVVLHSAVQEKALDKLVLYTDQLMLAVHRLWGRSAEKFEPQGPLLFDELIEALAAPEEPVADDGNKPSNRGRKEFYWIPPAANPAYFNDVVQYCRDRGLNLRLTSGGMIHSASLSFVAAGLGCTFVVSEVRWRKPKNVAVVPVGDLDLKVSLELLWHRENRQQALTNLVAAFAADRRRRFEEAPVS